MPRKKWSEEEITSALKIARELDTMEQEENFAPSDYWSYNDVPEIIEKARQGRGFPMGFNLLDGLVDNLRSGELVVVTAPTGVGKTTMCQTITKNLAEAGMPCLWFTLEVSLANFVQPLLKHDPNVEYLEDKICKLSSWPIFFPKNLVNLAFHQLEKMIKYAAIKFGVKAVFIDHLHYLVRGFGQAGRMENFSLFLGDRIRELRRVALEADVTIFLVAHMTKTEDGARPTLNNIRDTSFVAQEADVVLALWREKLPEPRVVRADFGEYEEVFFPWTNCAVEKSRRTGRKGVLSFSWKDGLYEELLQDEKTKMKARLEIASKKYAPRYED